MPPVYLIQDAFNAGEFSPKMAGQVTFDKYAHGCATLENFMALPEGPAQSRPGLRFVSLAKYNTNPCAVRPFIASVTQAYVLEFGNEYIRVYKNQAQLLIGTSTVEITSPYAASDVMMLQFSQLNDVMYIWHESYPPMKLLCYGDTDWVLETVSWNDGPYLDMNTTSGTQLMCSATTGSGITVSAAYKGGTSSYDAGVLTAASDQSVMTPTNPYGGFRFQTGSAGQLQSFRLQLNTPSTVSGNSANAYLYSDNSGSPGGLIDTAIGSGGSSLSGSGVLTNGQTTIYNVSNWSSWTQGVAISGTGIPDGSVVVSSAATGVVQITYTVFGKTTTSNVAVSKVVVISNSATVSGRESFTSPANSSTSLTAEGMLVFSFSSSALAANTWYWICFSATTPDAAITIGCVTTGSGYGSGVSGAGFTSITDSMGKEFCATVIYTPTGSASVFQAGHVGSTWRIQHNGTQSTKNFAATGTATAIEILGEFVVNIDATDDWAGTIQLEMSWDQVNWFTVAIFTTTTEQDFYENRTGMYYRLNCTSYKAGSAHAVLYEIERWGVFEITAFVSASQVTANVVSNIGSTSWTPFWREAAWSGVRGYPSCGCFRGQRLYGAASAHQPTTIWGSWVGDFENMSPGDTADSPVTSDIADFSNPIEWIMSSTDFLCGTMAEEANLSPASAGAITQTNPVDVKVTTNYGSQPGVRPIKIGAGLAFVQRGGLRVRLSAYSFVTTTYEADDLTKYADHITKPGIVDMAWQMEPNKTLWYLRSDGVLVGQTYYPEEKVIGAWRLVTDGTILSICCLPSVYGDTKGRTELWASVERTINGSTQISIELLADFEGVSTQADYVCLDCAVTQVFSTAQSTISGLSMFNGVSVGVFADGAPQPARTVSGGEITIDPPANKVTVGLPYTCTLKTLDLEGGAQNGTSQGRVREFEKVMMRVLNSYIGGVQIGLDENSLTPLSNWLADSTQTDAAPALFTGDVDPEDGWAGDAQKKATVCVVQTQPAPLCVVAFVPKLTVNE
jgi:hypothetical protein